MIKRQSVVHYTVLKNVKSIPKVLAEHQTDATTISIKHIPRLVEVNIYNTHHYNVLIPILTSNLVRLNNNVFV